MKRIRIVVAAGLVLLLFLGIVVMGAQDKKQQEVERQLRAAINTELNERNLKSAIEQYKKVAESGIRPLAAQALLHMADCYRQLGENDAQKVYDRIVNEYGDQTDVVAVARTQLVRMGSPATGRNMRRVCSWGPDCEGRISPDGKLIASIKFEGTYVRNLATGEARKIAEQVQDLLWAPDSKRLAYRSRAGSDSRSNSGVYVINADGADSRVIYRSAYTLLAWSSDGKRLLVDAPANSGEAAREPAKLLWITVSNGIAEPLPTKLRNPNGPAQVSPDGRHIAVNAAPDRSVSADSVPRGRGRGSPVGRSLYILASDGSGEASVMVSGAFPVLGWNRQGTQVFFRQADGSDLWAISVSGGKPQGDPVVVQSLERTAGGNDAYIREIADSETMYFDRPVGNETYTASFDTSTGKITSLPVRLPSGNGHRLAHWSTDGRRMLFVRDRDFWVFTFDSAAFASGTERRFVAGPDQLEPSCWSADEQSVLTSAGSPRNAIRLDLKTGETQSLLPNATDFSLSSCAGNLISNFSKDNVVVKDIKTGTEIQLYKNEGPELTRCSTENCIHSYLSHNGRFVAFEVRQETRSTLLIVPTEGGPIQELARAVPTAPWLSRRTLAWSPDDRYVFYVQPVTDQSWELFRVPVTGGAGQSTGLKGRATPRNIQFSPDGKRISFEVAEMNELWAIDIPATKK